MNLYPQDGEPFTFDQMEVAARKLINKEKDLSDEKFKSLESVAKAVYNDRMFPFRFVNIFWKKKKILGGAISRTGIIMVYYDFIIKYPWEDIIALKITRTYKDYGHNSTKNGYFYDIVFEFTDEKGFSAKMENMITNEFPQGIMSYNQKICANMFAFYYNRVRAERIQEHISNGQKKVLLHNELDPEYSNEIVRRFQSPKGVILKKIRKKVILKPDEINFLKGKKNILYTIKWDEIEDISIGVGVFSTVILFRFKNNDKSDYDTLLLNDWTLSPKIKPKNNKQKRNIFAICWLNLD